MQIARAFWLDGDWDRLAPILTAWARAAARRYTTRLSADDVDDVCASVVAKAWHQQTVPDNPGAWVETVTRNLVRNLRDAARYDARKADRYALQYDVLHSGPAAPGAFADRDHARAILAPHVRALPLVHRRTVRAVLTLPRSVAPQALGITPGNFNVRVQRIRATLRAGFGANTYRQVA